MKKTRSIFKTAAALLCCTAVLSACVQSASDNMEKEPQGAASSVAPGDSAADTAGTQANVMPGASSSYEVVQLGQQERRVITVGALQGASPLEDYVIHFNANQSVYLCKIKYYDNQSQLLSALEEGNAPDVLDLSGLDLPLSEDSFTELLPFLDSDPELSREALNPHVLTQSLTGGKMLSAPSGFHWYTLCARTADVGERDTWTTQDALELFARETDRYTQDMMPDRTEWFLRLSSSLFVDPVSQTCDFENEAFRSFLEFCRSFKERSKTEGEDSIPVRGDPQMLVEFVIGQNEHSISATKAAYGEDAFRYIGFPNESGRHLSFLTDADYDLNLAIPVQAADPAGAWEFIRGIYDRDWQLGMVRAFPLLQSALDERLALLVKEPGSNVTQEDIDYAMEMIGRTDCYQHTDRLLENTVVGQFPAFFDGSQSAEETASVVQSRVSELLSKRQ